MAITESDKELINYLEQHEEELENRVFELFSEIELPLLGAIFTDTDPSDLFHALYSIHKIQFEQLEKGQRNASIAMWHRYPWSCAEAMCLVGNEHFDGYGFYEALSETLGVAKTVAQTIWPQRFYELMNEYGFTVVEGYEIDTKYMMSTILMNWGLPIISWDKIWSYIDTAGGDMTAEQLFASIETRSINLGERVTSIAEKNRGETKRLFDMAISLYLSYRSQKGTSSETLEIDSIELPISITKSFNYYLKQTGREKRVVQREKERLFLDHTDTRAPLKMLIPNQLIPDGYCNADPEARYATKSPENDKDILFDAKILKKYGRSDGKLDYYIKESVISLPPLDEYEVFLQICSRSQDVLTLPISKKFKSQCNQCWEFISQKNGRYIHSVSSERNLRKSERIALLVPGSMHIDVRGLQLDDRVKLDGEWSNYLINYYSVVDENATYWLRDQTGQLLYRRQSEFFCTWSDEGVRVGFIWSSNKRIPVFGNEVSEIHILSKEYSFRHGCKSDWSAVCIYSGHKLSLPIEFTNTGTLAVITESLPALLMNASIIVTSSTDSQAFILPFVRLPLKSPVINTVADIVHSAKSMITYTISYKRNVPNTIITDCPNRVEDESSEEELVFRVPAENLYELVDVSVGDDSLRVNIELLGLQLSFDGYFELEYLNGNIRLPIDYYQNNPDFSNSLVLLGILNPSARVSIETEDAASRDERVFATNKMRVGSSIHLAELLPQRHANAKVELSIAWRGYYYRFGLFEFLKGYECGSFWIAKKGYIILRWERAFYSDVSITLAHGTNQEELTYLGSIEKGAIVREIPFGSMIFNGGSLLVNIARPQLKDEWDLDNQEDFRLAETIDVPKLECGNIIAKIDNGFSLEFEMPFLTDVVIAITCGKLAVTGSSPTAELPHGATLLNLGPSGWFQDIIESEHLSIWAKRLDGELDPKHSTSRMSYQLLGDISVSKLDIESTRIIGSEQGFDLALSSTGAYETLNMCMSIGIKDWAKNSQLYRNVLKHQGAGSSISSSNDYSRVILDKLIRKDIPGKNNLFTAYFILNQPRVNNMISEDTICEQELRVIWKKSPIWGYRVLRDAYAVTANDNLLTLTNEWIAQLLQFSDESDSATNAPKVSSLLDHITYCTFDEAVSKKGKNKFYSDIFIELSSLGNSNHVELIKTYSNLISLPLSKDHEELTPMFSALSKMNNSNHLVDNYSYAITLIAIGMMLFEFELDETIQSVFKRLIAGMYSSSLVYQELLKAILDFYRYFPVLTTHITLCVQVAITMLENGDVL